MLLCPSPLKTDAAMTQGGSGHCRYVSITHGSHRSCGGFKFLRKLHDFCSGHAILHSCEHFPVSNFSTSIAILMIIKQCITGFY